MLVLRYAYVLALTTWAGGMVILGAIVAPTLFQSLPLHEPDAGRALAGAAFGDILVRFHMLAYAAGVIIICTLAGMALLGPRPRNVALRMGITAGMLAVALYSGIVVFGELDAIQRSLPAASGVRGSDPLQRTLLPSQLPLDDVRRQRFEQLHHLSTQLMLVNMAGAFVLLFWEARELGK